jgi:hypothetical protein
MICLSSDTADAVFPVRFLVQSLVLFKESLAQWAPVRKDGSPNQHSTFWKLDRLVILLQSCQPYPGNLLKMLSD